MLRTEKSKKFPKYAIKQQNKKNYTYYFQSEIEAKIAQYLFQNNIEFEYDEPYPFNEDHAWRYDFMLLNDSDIKANNPYKTDLHIFIEAKAKPIGSAFNSDIEEEINNKRNLVIKNNNVFVFLYNDNFIDIEPLIEAAKDQLNDKYSLKTLAKEILNMKKTYPEYKYKNPNTFNLVGKYLKK